mmetsp:Transcript_9409/g.10626  ORF Transcript_9409/g.10626 Transcript_9409/m.10626 type:complete len:91 (-) Transcript_9409:521-793(-)
MTKGPTPGFSVSGFVWYVLAVQQDTSPGNQRPEISDKKVVVLKSQVNSGGPVLVQSSGVCQHVFVAVSDVLPIQENGARQIDAVVGIIPL